MKNDKKGMIFCFGIVSFIVALIKIEERSAFIICLGITIICFYNCRGIIFQMFSKPIIKRIIKLKLIEKELSNSLAEKNINKNTIDDYISSNKDIVKEIIRYKNQINDLTIKKKRLNENIFILEEKKENLENFMKQEEIIRNAIENEKKLHEVLTKENLNIENQKENLEEEISRLKNTILELEEKIIPLKNRMEIKLDTSLEYIDSLTGIEFEQYWAQVLFILGYESNCTKAAADYGIDVLATKDDILYGFQCKLYSQNVGNDAIQEALSGKLYYNCHVAIVVTNNYFTHNAIKQAEKSNIVLWDRDKLEEILNELKKMQSNTIKYMI